jgi:hypothetical protein
MNFCGIIYHGYMFVNVNAVNINSNVRMHLKYIPGYVESDQRF